MENLPLNSTIIDDDNHLVEHQDYPMKDENDDGVEISQTQSSSFINEKCLLDELLQTEEVKNGNSFLLTYLLESYGCI